MSVFKIGDRILVEDGKDSWVGTIEKGCCFEHAYVRADPKPKDGELRLVNRSKMSALAVSPSCRGAELAEAVKELLDTKSAPPAVAGRLEVEKWVALEKAYAAFRASGEAGPDYRVLAEQLYEGLKEADETIRQVGNAVGKASEETRVRSSKSIREYNKALFAYEAALSGGVVG
jgi:hypothetical protein